MASSTRHFSKVAVVCALLCALTSCGTKTSPTVAPSSIPASSLVSTDLKRGSGNPIVAGQYAVVQYTGWLYEPSAPENKGREFDSSSNTGKPFRFRVGAGEVIKGWDQGVLGMQPGGQRRLIIPPGLAYGDQGAGGVIPPGATLVFDVDLIGIE
jgi:FKBP-type peptidyl-prolyl cis-trans isomerase FkpA